jgi:hypothetical protein
VSQLASEEEEQERVTSKRMNAKTLTLPTSHVPMLSKPGAVAGVSTPNVKNRTFRNVAKTYRQPKAKCNTFLQREMLDFSVESGSLQKRSMLLKNSSFGSAQLRFLISSEEGEVYGRPHP